VGSFFAAKGGAGEGREAKKGGFCRFDEILWLSKKIKWQKNELFYKKLLTNGRIGVKIVNCIIIARIVGALVNEAKRDIVKLHKHRMSKTPQPIVIFSKRYL
jgi:hypothetical protein